MRHPTDITDLPATPLTLHLAQATDAYMLMHPGLTWLEVLQALEQIRFELTEKLICQREADLRCGLSLNERGAHGNDR